MSRLLTTGILQQARNNVAGFLLDLYPNAAAAYSLRQLKTGVTNVVRVRRSSDNVEQNFTPTQITDGTLTTFTGAGNGFVSRWYDQSGNNKHAYESAASTQPRIVNSGLVETVNGKPSISFENGNVQLGANLTTSFNTNDAHMMLVSKASSTGVNTTVASWAKNGSNISYIRVIALNSTTWRFTPRWGGSDDFIDTQNSSPLNQHFISMSIKNSTNTITIREDDGGIYSKVSSVNFDSASDKFFIGQARTPNPTGYYNGKTQEVLVFNQSVTGVDELGIRNEVNNHYNIY